MAHMIQFLKCKRGHNLPIGFDNNECGCHHEGKPCLVINCKACFEENLKNEVSSEKLYDVEQIYIPLDEEGAKIVRELLDLNRSGTGGKKE